jgi:hypothetical protein
VAIAHWFGAIYTNFSGAYHEYDKFDALVIGLKKQEIMKANSY